MESSAAAGSDVQGLEGADLWRELDAQLRVDSIRSTTAAGSGHPTSSMSAASLMAVLLSKYLRYDFDAPRDPGNDHLILSKGHAAPLLYATYKAAGAIGDDEMLTLRKFGSRIEGHPVPVLPWVDVATGSLGQGLPIGVGIALSGRYLEAAPFRVWVFMGDSEMAEGSIWEAFDKASHYKLGRLVGILDMNRLGQRGETALGWDAAAYAERARGFGWQALEIDGHDHAEIDSAYAQALEDDEVPTLIVARTLKGHGVAQVENKNGWHGKPFDAELARQAIEELGGERQLLVKPHPPEPFRPPERETAGELSLPAYELGAKVATRKAYGDALAALGRARPDVVVVDAEVGNSTFADEFAEVHPERFFEIFIAEQTMVAAAVGLHVRGWTAFGSTFAAFFSRAYDFIRMAAVSRASLRLCGSHAGVSIGQDGPSQMALEDLAMMRAVDTSTVLYPSDGNQAAALTAAMADLQGIVYLRTTRAATPVIYGAGEQFPVGGSRTVRSSEGDQVTLVGAGITLHEALDAAEALAQDGIGARVVDAYSVKPIDAEGLRAAARATGGRVVVAEDHWPEGGLGDAVLEALATPDAAATSVVRLGVAAMPGSGTPEELIDAAGIGARAIAEAARSIV